MADQDPQSASNLIGMAVKMIYGLKLHLPSNRTVHYHTRHHHERIFWIAYIIDRDLSLITSEPYLLRDDEIGLNIKDIMCSEGTGNVRNDYYDTIEILEPRAELAQIQGKLYDLVRSLKASKFSLTQKRSVEERLYRMLREWHKHLYEPRIDKNMYPGKPEELESRSHRLHEALLHLAYYRCLYSVANLSVSNRDWMQKLNDFSDRYNDGEDTSALTSTTPLLPWNWRHLADSARWCENVVLDPIQLGDQVLNCYVTIQLQMASPM